MISAAEIQLLAYLQVNAIFARPEDLQLNRAILAFDPAEVDAVAASSLRLVNDQLNVAQLHSAALPLLHLAVRCLLFCYYHSHR